MTVRNYSPIDELVAVSKPKESEPIVGIKEKPLQEFLTPSSTPTSYMKYVPESIRLPDELKKIGVKDTQDMKPVIEKEIELPISDEKIVSGEHAPLTSSLRWLATLCIYILSKAHITLKVIHGKVVRRKQSR